MEKNKHGVVGGLFTAKTVRAVKRRVKRELDDVLKRTEKELGIKIVKVGVSQHYKTLDGLIAKRVLCEFEEA